MGKVLCSIVFGCNLFSLAYNLSRERIDFNNPILCYPFRFFVFILIEFDQFAWHVFILACLMALCKS